MGVKKPATKAAKKTGRPRTHDRAALMAAVCERIASGMLVIDAAKAEGVDPRRIREWALEDEFAPLYARARDLQAHALAEEAIRIADTGMENGSPMTTDAVSHARLRVDTRKWLVSKIAPRTYGERVTQEVVGEVKHEHRGSVRIAGMDIPL